MNSPSTENATPPEGELPGMLAVAKGIAEQRFPHTMDAGVWATEFVKLNPGADEGLMLSWFANAIMAGYDTARAKPHQTQPANADGWTDWISPTDIDLYGLQCCDCGLKHEVQFRVTRNKAYTDGEHWYADPVPVEEGYNVAFRMRR